MEAEFIGAFRYSIKDLGLECVSSVRKCDSGSTFEGDLLIDFEADDLLTVEAFQAAIEESLKRALNNLYRDAANCNPELRQVDSVIAQCNFTLNALSIALNSTVVDNEGRWVEQKGFIASR
jgi:hypothetical protein